MMDARDFEMNYFKKPDISMPFDNKKFSAQENACVIFDMSKGAGC